MQLKFIVRRNAVITLAVIGMSALSPITRKAVLWVALAFTLPASGQNPGHSPGPVGGPSGGPDFPPPGFDGPPPFGPRGPGGFGAMRETKLVARFDKDDKGWLNTAERKAAREYLYQQATNGSGMRRGPRWGRPPWARADDEAPAKPGTKVSPSEVENLSGQPLYCSNIIRTLFLDFEETDWEKEMAEFKRTDIEVPARLTVDGRTYADVGVHFHGMSSFMMVSEGHKRSLVLTLDLVHHDQQLEGYHKLNLLNSHEDPSFLRTVLSMLLQTLLRQV